MKTLALVIFSSICLIGCNSPKNTKKSAEESVRIAREDSISKAKADSTAKAEAELEEFRNAPWKYGLFTDEFGDFTDKAFIKTDVEGVFSNSATSGSKLFAQIKISKDAAGFFLCEYDKTSPPVYFIGTGQIRMKNAADEKLSVPVTGKWNQRGGVKVKGASFTKLVNFMKKSEGEITVIVLEEFGSRYVFLIDMKGFNDWIGVVQ